MTKNNLKIVKSDDKKQKELKEKSKSLEAAISQIDQNQQLLLQLIRILHHKNNLLIHKYKKRIKLLKTKLNQLRNLLKVIFHMNLRLKSANEELIPKSKFNFARR